LTDMSGSGNKIKFNNATLIADRNGVPNNAYLFNGINTYMTSTTKAALNFKNKNEITLYAIIKVNDFYQGDCHENMIFEKNLDGVFAKGNYYLSFTDAYFYDYTGCYKKVKETRENFTGFWGDASDYTMAIDTAHYVQTEKWYKLAYSYDGDSAKLYVNGNL